MTIPERSRCVFATASTEGRSTACSTVAGIRCMSETSFDWRDSKRRSWRSTATARRASAFNSTIHWSTPSCAGSSGKGRATKRSCRRLWASRYQYAEVCQRNREARAPSAGRSATRPGLHLRRLGNLLADQRDLLIAQSLFVQPVGARDFLEGIDGSLDAFSPGYGDELDVAMDISDSKDPLRILCPRSSSVLGCIKGPSGAGKMEIPAVRIGARRRARSTGRETGISLQGGEDGFDPPSTAHHYRGGLSE